MTDDFEGRLALKIAAYHDAALLHAAIVLGLPERMEQRGVAADDACRGARPVGPASPSPLARACEPRHLRRSSGWDFRPHPSRPISPSGCPATAKSPDRRRAILAPLGQSRRFGHNGQARFRTESSARTLRIGAATTPKPARCSTLISRRRRWPRLRPSSSALDLAGVESVADIGGGYGGLLAGSPASQSRSSRHPVRSPTPDRGGVSRSLQAQGVADRVEHIRRRSPDRDPRQSRSLCAERRAPAMGRCARARDSRQLPQGDAARGEGSPSSSGFSPSRPWTTQPPSCSTCI